MAYNSSFYTRLSPVDEENVRRTQYSRHKAERCRWLLEMVAGAHLNIKRGAGTPSGFPARESQYVAEVDPTATPSEPSSIEAW